MPPLSGHIIQEGTLNGVFPAVGFASGLIVQQQNSVVSVNIRCDKNTTFKLHTSPSQSLTEKSLFFQKTIAASTTFHRRFACPNQFLQVELINDDAAAGNVIMLTTATQGTQFDCSTFLNSNIGIDATTNLVRVGNDYNTDMVREIHPDFKKVNIQGITDQQHATEFTCGNGSTDLFANGNAANALYIKTINAADVSGGTGARAVKVTYIDSNYDEQVVTKTLGAGVGSIAVGVTGFAVLRAEVTSTGTSYKNVGVIQLTDVGGTLIFATIDAEANVSHTAGYLIPRNKHLIVTDAQISAVGFQGILRIYEYDFSTSRIRGSIGDFRLSSNNLAQTFRLNGKIGEKKMIMVNVIPDAGVPVAKTNICININAVLCPVVNPF